MGCSWMQNEQNSRAKHVAAVPAVVLAFHKVELHAALVASAVAKRASATKKDAIHKNQTKRQKTRGQTHSETAESCIQWVV